MSREVIPFTTEENWLAARRRDLTSTDISALFGVSPYCTAFELFHRKAGNIDESNADNERTRWGKRLQDSIAAGVAEDQAWILRRMDEYVRDPEIRLGSSFDYGGAAYNEEDSPWAPALVPGSGLKPDFIVECKNVDSLQFSRGWTTTDFGIEAPAAIELQMQHQLGVSGLREGYIAAFIGGNRVELLHRQFDELVWQRILDLAAWFWSLKEAPAPDYSKDYEIIGRLHGYSAKGKVIEASPRIEELMAIAKSAGEESVAWEKKQKAAKAELLTLAGDAERVEGSAFYALAKAQPETTVESFVRKASRPLRIYERKS